MIGKTELVNPSVSASQFRASGFPAVFALGADDDDSITLVIGKAANTYAESLREAELTQEQIKRVICINFSSADVTDMTSLDRFPNAASIILKDCPRIKELDLNGNLSIDVVEAWRCPALESVNVKGCVSLDILEGVDCPKLKTVNIEDCGELKTIAFNNTSIAELDVSACSGLVYLDVTECLELASLMSRLRKIFANEMPLTSLNASGCSELQDLSFANTASLNSLNIAGCRQIRRLNLIGSSIETLDVSSNEALSNLDISGCASLDKFNAGGCFAGRTESCWVRFALGA